MIHYQDDRVVLYRGDCRDVLRALPEASVHCVVTSPPYWGLRDYGLEPLVWPADTAFARAAAPHEHQWGARVRVHKGGPTGENSRLEGRVANAERDATKDVDAGAFCDRCGAWRGSLGLEPQPELYVIHLVDIFREVRRVLRPDGVVWLNLGDCYATGAGQVGEHPGGGAQGARWAGRREGDQLGEEGSDRSATRRTRLAGRGRHEAATSGKAGPRLEAMGPMTQPNRLPLPGLKPKDLVGIPWRAAFALQADGWWLRADVVWAKGASFLEGPAPFPDAHFATFPPRLVAPCVLAGCPPGGVVLDPFAGACTTLMVAKDLGRRAVGVELKPEYCRIGDRRLRQEVLAFEGAGP